MGEARNNKEGSSRQETNTEGVEQLPDIQTQIDDSGHSRGNSLEGSSLHREIIDRLESQDRDFF